jgi:cellulose synthase/poly-beta-1,6-N-acetylglucosamine synthase-like glycosyltransferase
MVGADGAMYAIRRVLFRAPAVDTILDDFVIAMKIAQQGYLVIHEQEAIGFELNRHELAAEFRRKARITAGGFQSVFKGDIFALSQQPLLMFKFISHKLLRWCSGAMMITLLLLLVQTRLMDALFNPYLATVLYVVSGSLVVAGLAYILPIMRRSKPINMLYYLCMLACASVFGLYLGLTGSQQVTWRRGDM